MRKTTITALVIILAAGFFFALTVRRGHAWAGDFAMYVMHARNLAEGKPYSDTCYVFNPGAAYLGPPAYPPGLPLLLAPVYKLAGAGLTAMKLELIVFFLLFLWFSRLLFARYLPPAYALCLTGLLAFNPVYWDYKDFVYPEFLFMAFLYLCLWLAAAERDKEKSSPAAQLMIGAAAYLCYSTRAVGIVIIPALMADDLLRRRGPLSVRALKYAVFAVFALLQSGLFSWEGNYIRQFAGYSSPWTTALGNLKLYALAGLHFLENGYSPLTGALLSLAVMLLALAGFARKLRAGATVMELFALFYLGAILLYPAADNYRYLIPVFPLFIFYALRGLADAVPAARPGGYLLAGLTLALSASYAGAYCKAGFKTPAEGIAKKESAELFDHVRSAVGPSDLVVFRHPRTLCLYTGKRSSVYAPFGSDAEFREYLERADARYLVIGRIFDDDMTYLAPFIMRNGACLKKTFSNADFKVFKIAGGCGGASR